MLEVSNTLPHKVDEVPEDRIALHEDRDIGVVTPRLGKVGAPAPIACTRHILPRLLALSMSQEQGGVGTEESGKCLTASWSGHDIFHIGATMAALDPMRKSEQHQ